jgi:HD-GYP domain-containing protein (c-di-GMP phosphodiesterase class II)
VVEFPWPIAAMAQQHHERIDGSGYPAGLRNGQICEGARILAVSDVIEAMSSHRPYRAALGIGPALEEIERGAGRIYDADAAAAALRLFRDKGYAIPA